MVAPTASHFHNATPSVVWPYQSTECRESASACVRRISSASQTASAWLQAAPVPSSRAAQSASVSTACAAG
eukprot:scaffold49180_cov32-Tisochrysis_lutea.AAC.6